MENNKSNLSKAISKSTEITHEKMMQLLGYAYDTTLKGLPGEKSVYTLVDDYLSKYDRETAISKLINNQTAKAATSGFVTGFGGFVTMPVTIPANIATVVVFQMRMIAAIACIRGYDLESDQVQTFVYVTLAGSTIADIVKRTGIVISNKMANKLVTKIPRTVLTKINQKVGFRLVTKFGTKGSVNLWKLIPVAGAVVGGGVDTLSTRTIARFAKKTFTETGINLGDNIFLPKNEL